VSEHLRIGMENAIAARTRIGEQRFLDVHHVRFTENPMRTVWRLYEFLGLELEPSVAQTMQEWQAANRSGAHGAHRYTPEQFGLTAEQVRADYDFYIRHFDVTVEEGR
jgi:hypothetical protein